MTTSCLSSAKVLTALFLQVNIYISSGVHLRLPGPLRSQHSSRRSNVSCWNSRRLRCFRHAAAAELPLQTLRSFDKQWAAAARSSPVYSLFCSMDDVGIDLLVRLHKHSQPKDDFLPGPNGKSPFPAAPPPRDECSDSFIVVWLPVRLCRGRYLHRVVAIWH